MRIGIDCDGVLRDFIPALIDSIKETHPEHADKIKTSTSWDWEQWLPFWTDAETEKYVFEDNYIDLFGIDVPPIESSIEDWPKLLKWAKENKLHYLDIGVSQLYKKNIIVPHNSLIHFKEQFGAQAMIRKVMELKL